MTHAGVNGGAKNLLRIGMRQLGSTCLLYSSIEQETVHVGGNRGWLDVGNEYATHLKQGML
jgi:hypothetical protein